MDKCSQIGCNEIPCLTVYWPGKTPPPRYCIEHAQKAKNILGFMGIPVHIEPYQPSVNKYNRDE